MGRRLPRQTARKSTGERRLPDKTNNARDSSEDGSEEVRGTAARGPPRPPAAGAGARAATSQRQNERHEQQLPDNRGGPHLEQQLEMTKKRGRGRPLGSRKITCTKTPLPPVSVGWHAIVLQVPDKKRTNRNARDLAACVKSDAKERGLKLPTVQKIQSLAYATCLRCKKFRVCGRQCQNPRQQKMLSSPNANDEGRIVCVICLRSMQTCRDCREMRTALTIRPSILRYAERSYSMPTTSQTYSS